MPLSRSQEAGALIQPLFALPCIDCLVIHVFCQSESEGSQYMGEQREAELVLLLIGYEDVAVLGCGGAGVVFRAKDT